MRKRSMKKSMRRLRDVERLAFDGPGGATEDTENTEINTEKFLFGIFSVQPSVFSVSSVALLRLIA